MKDLIEDFDGRFMNNGINGLLDDKFQDQKMLLIRKCFIEAIQQAREEKLSATYKSSKMYLMGHRDGEKEAMEKMKKALLEERSCELCLFPKPECNCIGFNLAVKLIKKNLNIK